MSGQPRLLFLSQTLPYPVDSGVAIRTYNVLRILAAAFDVTALCFYRSKGGKADPHLASSRAALNKLARTEVFPIPQEHAPQRYVWDHLRSVVARRVYTRYAYQSSAFQQRLDELLRDHDFDLVHADSLDLSGYLARVQGLPVVCVHHNVESELLRRRGQVERHLWRRQYLFHQARLMEQEERRWCPRVALNVAVSAADAALLRQRAAGSEVLVVPNGVDLDYFRAEPGKDEGIVFLGGTTWFPNRDALGYLVADILPEIRRRKGDVPVRWVGHVSDEERRTFGGPGGIEFVGYVPDVRPWLRDAACSIVPLRVGGGTRLKILDAWAMGKPIVSTSIGCEGLDAVDGDNLLIRDDPAGFADAACRLLDDAALRRRLGGQARATVERSYGWSAIGARMVQRYHELLPAASVAAP